MTVEHLSHEVLRSDKELFRRLSAHCRLHGTESFRTNVEEPRVVTLDTSSILEEEGDPIALTYVWPHFVERYNEVVGNYLVMDFAADEQGVWRQVILDVDQEKNVQSHVAIEAPPGASTHAPEIEDVTQMLDVHLLVDTKASFEDFLRMDTVLSQLDRFFAE